VVVEADSELAAIARKNLRFNSSKSFTVVEQAVDYTQPNAEHVSFQKSDDSSTGHIRPLIDSSSSSSISAQRVPRTTIGEIIRRHGIGEFSLVADIEGAEVGLLYNGEEHLASCDTVIIELHREKLNGRVISIQQSRDRIIDLGFDLIDERNNVFVFKKNK
jgi:FkbM family methyltransferase